MTPDLSICVVNFNTVRFLRPLLDSLETQSFEVDGRPGTWEMIFVDNASKGEDAFSLQELAEKDDRIRVVQNFVNAGYAQANNQGFHVGRGRYHMVLNPDTRLLDGCLAEMVGHLEQHADVAMVGAKSYMDLDATFIMPPNEMPTPALIRAQTDAQFDGSAAVANLDRRTAYSYPYWAAEEPLEMEMLSGSCVLFRRELYADEFPFDPGFPLYYEDTDMFMRLQERGAKMVHLPKAEMIHFFSRAAYTHTRGAQYRSRIGEERFFRKYFEGDDLASWLEDRDRQDARGATPPVDPFEFEVVEAGAKAPEFYPDHGHDAYYVEIAGNPAFTLAAAMFPEDDGWFSISRTMWEELGPGQYWVRIVSKQSMKTLQAWIVRKELDE